MVVMTTSDYIQIITAGIYAAALFYTVITFRRSKKLDQITQTNVIMYSWRDLEIELDKVPPGSDYDISRKQWVYRMFNDIEWLCFLINEMFKILDHIFQGAGLEWTVYVRVLPNGNGSTITWTFIKPDGLGDEQFKEQLKSFDSEIDAWRRALERQIYRISSERLIYCYFPCFLFLLFISQ
jgi:hypothetical protein